MSAPLWIFVHIHQSHGSVGLMNVCSIVNTCANSSIPRIRGIGECWLWCKNACTCINPTDPWNRRMSTLLLNYVNTCQSHGFVGLENVGIVVWCGSQNLIWRIGSKLLFPTINTFFNPTDPWDWWISTLYQKPGNLAECRFIFSQQWEV